MKSEDSWVTVPSELFMKPPRLRPSQNGLLKWSADPR